MCLKKKNEPARKRFPGNASERGQHAENAFFSAFATPKEYPDPILHVRTSTIEEDAFYKTDAVVTLTDSQQIRMQIKAHRISFEQMKALVNRRVVPLTVFPTHTDADIQLNTLESIKLLQTYTFEGKLPTRKEWKEKLET